LEGRERGRRERFFGFDLAKHAGLQSARFWDKEQKTPPGKTKLKFREKVDARIVQKIKGKDQPEFKAIYSCR
jgi:hypothetical protein